MDIYSIKAASHTEKLFITATQVVFIFVAAWIMFGVGGTLFVKWPGLSDDLPLRRAILIVFSIVSLARFSLMMFVFLKRRIAPAELVSVPLAFFLYYVVFSILVLPYGGAFDLLDMMGILLFVTGSGINSLSEWQRFQFKSDPANKGKLFNGGLFSRAMHINYLGDIMWVSGYALVAHHPMGALIPLVLAAFFIFSGIPALDRHLADRYGADFTAYAAKTKKLMPGIW